MADFAIGSADPKLTPDAGAGVWNSNPVTFEFLAKKEGILIILPAASLVVGPDAARHMEHYLENTGAALTINLRGMLDEVPSAGFNYDEELKEAAAFVETLPPGRHAFTSRRIERGRAQPLYNRQSESRNWYFAIGGYSAWGKGDVTVALNAGKPTYSLLFTYKFYDRYNWDGKKSVTLAGVTITDATMGEFHREGIAQEYDCNGEVSANYTWAKGETPRLVSQPAPAPAVPQPSPAPPPPPGPPPIPIPKVPQPKPSSPIAPPAGSKTHTVKSGETLSKLSALYYGKPNFWPRIYEANKGLIGLNPNLIRPGQVLTIP